MNKIECLILGMIFMLNGLASEADTLTILQMHEDVDYYFETLKKINPFPYDRYSESYFDSIRNVIKGDCTEPMPVQKFLFRIGTANKLTGYHTGIDGLIKYNHNFDAIHNITFKYDKLYYNNIEIVSINNIPAYEIYRRTDGLISWEYTEQERQSQLQRMICLVLNQYGIKGPPYQAKIRSENGILEVEIKGVHYDFAWPRYFQQQAPYLDTLYHEPVISMRFAPQDSLAVLYYNSSDPENNKEIRKGIESFFKKVHQQGIKNIFIDVSMNLGGSSLLHDYIFKHLCSPPYEIKWKAYATQNGIACLEESYRKLLSKKIWTEFKDIAQNGVKEFSEQNQVNTPGYDGKVFVIMGAKTFSAGHTFCEKVRTGKKGILVGEVAGQRSPYTGTAIDFVLPHSKIPFTCGSYSYILEPTITDSEGFLQPDIPYPMAHPLGIADYKKIIHSSKH